MRYFNIDNIGLESIRRAELLLGDIPGDVNKAVSSATEKVAKYLLISSSPLIRKRFAISAGVLKE